MKTAIINLRGNVVTVVDNRKRFGLPPKEPDDSTRIIIVEEGEMVVGILVDGVAEVADLAESDIETAGKVNSLAPELLAFYSNLADAKLIHVSTDYVFAGDGHSS